MQLSEFHKQFMVSLYFSVNLRTKRSAVEKQMEVERFQEELPLIKREMKSFISFYKDVTIPSIEKKKTDLQASLISNSVYVKRIAHNHTFVLLSWSSKKMKWMVFVF